MLNRFRVNNFKNLINVEFRPTGVSLLIGPNNAGKTNLCSALRLLSASAFNPLDAAAGMVLGENWNLTNVYVKDRSIELEADVQLVEGATRYDFSYTLRLSAERQAITAPQDLRVVDEMLFLSGPGYQRTPLIENHAGRARLLNEKRFMAQSDPLECYQETQVPVDATALSKLFDTEANHLAIWFRKFFANIAYFNLNPRSMRQPRVAGKSSWVTPDGENFGKFLYTLHNENPRLERRILELLRLVEPKVDLFTFYSPDPDFILFFLEDKHRNRFSAQSVSDGTLRYLALCCLVAMMADARTESNPHPLLLWEEPENGLYVGHLKQLVEQLDFAGSTSQCIFTSHSPYFIDLFDGHLEGVHLMKPGMPSSILVRPDPQRIKPLLDQMPLGELHYRELLS
jgi:predicted ATPase